MVPVASVIITLFLLKQGYISKIKPIESVCFTSVLVMSADHVLIGATMWSSPWVRILV